MWGKQSGAMAGIISATLGGCVPVTYYSFPVLVSFLHNWNPRQIEKDIFLHIYLWLAFLQSKPCSCDSCLYHMQTHHYLTDPHQGSISGIAGDASRWTALLWAHLATIGFDLLSFMPSWSWPTCKDGSYPLLSIFTTSAAFLCLQQSPGEEGISVSPWDFSSLRASYLLLTGAVAEFISFSCLGRGKEFSSFSAE